MPLHEDQKEANRKGLSTFNTAVVIGLTDAMIAPVTTVKGTAATAYVVVVAAVPSHEDQKGALIRVNKAGLAMEALGVYTDANLAAANTATGVRALHTAQDATITNSLQYGSLFGE